MFTTILPCLGSPGKGRLDNRAVLALVLLGGAWAVAPAPARADKLDVGLLQSSNLVLDKLYTAKVKNVGILPFRVIKGEDKPSFMAGPICTGMTTRLENMLIMNNSAIKEETIGILSNVCGVATRNRIGAWYEKAAERARLFDLNYPLAWGNLKAQPDALLTGEIINDGDRSKTRVVIEAIYRKDPTRLVKLTDFDVDTDRSLMGDLGYNFTLSKVARRGSRDNRDRMVASLVRRRGQAATPENVGGMSVGIQYNDKPVAIKPVSEDAANPEYYIPPVPAGTKFTLTLTYNGQESRKLGVIVKLNGRSTFNEEKGDSITLRKWLYTAEKHKGQPDLFTGFTYEGDGENVKPFKVLSSEESAGRETELGERVGWIDVDVFASQEPSKDDEDDVTKEESKTVSSRGVPPVKPASAEEAQKQYLKANGLKLEKPSHRRDLEGSTAAKGGGLLVPDEKAAGSVELTTGSLPKPILIGTLRIKYYDPEK